MKADDEQLEKARALYECDDIEIDDDAEISVGDDGFWVSAWVWVNEPEEDDE